MQAPQPLVLGPHDVVPMPPLLLKAERQGIPRPILLTFGAVRHVWGMDISVGHQQAGEALPAPIATRVVLQLDGEAGDGPTVGGGSGGGSGGGAQRALPPLPGGPFPAELRSDFKHGRGGVRSAYLTGRLAGPELQRAVAGLERVGLRRLDDGTVALVVARPPGYQPPEPLPVRAAWAPGGVCVSQCICGTRHAPRSSCCAHTREVDRARGHHSAPTRGVPLVQAPQPLGPHDVVPMPPILLKGNNKCSARPILLTLGAVRHVWGLDMSVGHRQGGEAPPAPIDTRVVLQLDGEAGDGPAGGGGAMGEALPPLPEGPFPAELRFSFQVQDRGGVGRAYLQARLYGPELLRAVVGLKRVGLRRLDAGTVALVVARPPGYQPPRPSPVRAAGVKAGACWGVCHHNAVHIMHSCPEAHLTPIPKARSQTSQSPACRGV